MTLYINRVPIQEREDYKADMTLFFIELLHNMDIDAIGNDENLKRYIAVSLKFFYYQANKKINRTILMYTDFDESYMLGDSKRVFYNLEDVLDELPFKQRQVIIWKYFYGFSDTEISSFLNISRQAVCRLKNRALNTLRHSSLDYIPF